MGDRDECERWEGGSPPASRNQRVPTGGEIPHLIAASSLDRPDAIDTQNRRRCSLRATGGRPGDLGLPRSARSERRRPAIATALRRLLRRPPGSTTSRISLDAAEARVSMRRSPSRDGSGHAATCSGDVTGPRAERAGVPDRIARGQQARGGRPSRGSLPAEQAVTGAPGHNTRRRAELQGRAWDRRRGTGLAAGPADLMRTCRAGSRRCGCTASGSAASRYSRCPHARGCSGRSSPREAAA